MLKNCSKYSQFFFNAFSILKGRYVRTSLFAHSYATLRNFGAPSANASSSLIRKNLNFSYRTSYNRKTKKYKSSFPARKNGNASFYRFFFRDFSRIAFSLNKTKFAFHSVLYFLKNKNSV